jgi:hypothetical protein
MKYILNMSDFLTEKKVTYKRQYTESYPAQHASTVARVRNAVLNAMADGVLTEEELQGILRTANAGSRWLQRNGDLFKITEDETGRSYCLSNKGQRIMRATGGTLTESKSFRGKTMKDFYKMIKGNEYAQILVNGSWYGIDVKYLDDQGWEPTDDSIFATDPDGEEYEIQLDQIETVNVSK